MKHLDKIGFVLALIGVAGMGEAYGFNRQFSISLILIICGAVLVLIGDVRNDAKNYKRSNDIDSRPYFLH